MSDYEIVTRQQAANFLSHIKGDSSVQTSVLLFSVENALSVQKEKLLQNQLYYDKTSGEMDEAVAKSYFEIEKNIAMCQILRLALNSLPVPRIKPKYCSKVFSDECKQLTRLFGIEDSETELLLAKRLLSDTGTPNFGLKLLLIIQR